ncbi:hypothetical protein [Aquibacillus sediminis]|nr:hypothetical protein [Aquibacillus sediminis]
MVSKQEELIFIKELKLLINDFERCEDIEIKAKIHEDINLLVEVIRPHKR